MNIFEKHNILLRGNERFYIEDLNERDYVLEGATPIYIMIDDKYLSERSWIGLIPKLALHLQSKSPKSKEELISYRTGWTKTPMYTAEKRINFQPIFDNLYITPYFTIFSRSFSLFYRHLINAITITSHQAHHAKTTCP